MSSQVAAVWASATGAAIAVAGAAAVYWTHPAFLWPRPAPVVASGNAPEAPAPAPPVPSQPPTAAASAAPPTVQKPSFDVVSVEPTGETVVAGRAAPDAKVELKDDGKTVAEATANSEGQFVIIPPTLPPGEHSLALSTGVGPLAQTSSAITVAVVAPEPAPKAAAPAPPPSASAPPPSTTVLASSPEQGSHVAVHSVEASLGGRLVAKGVAAPNAVVRLYLSGAYVGDAKTKADGRWSLTIEHGMTPGPYEMRADEINPADAKVAARAEAPFNYPAASAAPGPSAAEPSAPAPSSADVVLDSIQTHHVVTGHTLWGISQKYYGDGSRYQVIYAANSNQIRSPSLIYPGQVFVIPKEDRKP